jgi:hypothetical protein
MNFYGFSKFGINFWNYLNERGIGKGLNGAWAESGPSGLLARLNPSGRLARAVPGHTHNALNAVVTARAAYQWRGHR